MLTAKRLRKLLHYDPQTGLFIRLEAAGTRWKAGDTAGWIHKHNGYAYVSVESAEFFAHRLAWLYMTGEWPTKDIDHIDGDKANNRFANLREVSEQVNAENQKRAHKGSKSGLLGVYPSGNRWRAMIGIERKLCYLGTFDTPEEAHAAYLAVKRVRHSGCAI